MYGGGVAGWRGGRAARLRLTNVVVTRPVPVVRAAPHKTSLDTASRPSVICLSDRYRDTILMLVKYTTGKNIEYIYINVRC